MLWMVVALATGSAGATEVSGGLQALTGAGVAVGAAGAATSGFGLALLSGPEPVGFFVLYPPGTAMLLAGAGMGLGGSLAQARRLGAPATAGMVGLGLVGAGLAAAAVGVGIGSEGSAMASVIGGTSLASAGLVAAAAQGAVNRRAGRAPVPASSLSLSVVPEGRGAGLRLSGSW